MVGEVIMVGEAVRYVDPAEISLCPLNDDVPLHAPNLA